MSDIGAWLESLGLGQFAERFRESLIDHEVLSELDDADLRELDLPLGARKKILKAIQALEPPADGTTAVASPAPAATDGVAEPPQEKLHHEAERRQLTVFFCDLVGSTELSARLDPEDMRGVIQGYQDACAGVITRFEGHVAKFLGDGVLAYFGWPRAHEDDAERAVRAGLAVSDAVAGLAAYGRPLAARVGIATGLVVVGDLVGEGAAQEEAVVGETPNLAARLQALAAPGQVVIAPSTQHLLGDLFELTDLGAKQLKGLPQLVKAWAVVGEGYAESRFEARRRGHLTPLVGRDEELGLLLSRWRRATESEGQVVLLSGEPGIGKSRITEALRERLADESHIELRYFCSPFHINSALHPVLEQLVRAAGFERDDDDLARLAKLEALLARGSGAAGEATALLAPLLSLVAGERYPPLDLSPQRQKQRTLQLLTDQVADLAKDRPVVMILEDAHWLDPTTQELFDLLIERLRG